MIVRIVSSFNFLGIVQKANGSAYLETSGTKLTCSVFGPRDYVRKHDFSSSGKLTCELSFVPFARKERCDTGSKSLDKLNAEYSSVITESLISAVCLNSYPKSQIDVYINVLEDDGNTLSYGIVAAAIALADAGIEMTDLVTSSSLVFNDDFYCLDPTESEQCSKNIIGKMTVAYLPSLNQISCLLQDGEVDVDKSVGMINTCIEGCLRMHELMKDCLVSSHSVVNEKLLNS